jgi:hypothetical protein
MKWLKVFSLFVLMHAVAWAVAHAYQSKNPSTVLVVADTSFNMKPHFVSMENWIDNFEQTGRYQEILIGTDKAMIGPLSEIQSRNSIFRAAFGKSSAENLQRYSSSNADSKIWLSDGSFKPEGWRVITFD